MKIPSKLISKIKWQNLIKRWKSDSPPMLFDCGPDLEDRGICGVEACNADKCYEEPRVVIVGAGMAGLSAAARLSQRGINNIVVLEAYERPGGRILSCWLGDIVAELGASWQPKNVSTHPIYSLSTFEDPPRPGVPGVEHPRGLFNNVVSGKMPFPSTITAYHKFRQIEEEAAQIYCLGGNKQQGSLINFMSLRIQQELHEYPEEQQHDAARIMFGLTHMLHARCGDDIGLLCADHSGCYMNMPGGDVRVPLGHVGILAPLLRQIPEGAIRYCKPVNCIYWGTCMKSGCRAYVYTTDGEEFQADYVILTPSIGVLCSNAVKLFCPSLPYPATVLRSFWSSDPYFLGAYSTDCANTDGYAQRCLACPVPGPSEPIPPILLFAGEATVPGMNGTVAAARLSGIREAERIVKLTLQYKGPPLPYGWCTPCPPCEPKKQKMKA